MAAAEAAAKKAAEEKVATPAQVTVSARIFVARKKGIRKAAWLQGARTD